MLRAIPKGLFSNDYEIYRDEDQVAFLDPSAWREKAELEIEGQRYKLDREGWVGEFRLLDKMNHPVAKAAKTSAFKNRFEVEQGERRFVLDKTSFWSRGFSLWEVVPGPAGSEARESLVGQIDREGLLTRRAVIDLPEDLPLPVQVFLFWLVVVLWNRQKNSG